MGSDATLRSIGHILVGDDYARDAIHVAVAPVVALETLEPGQHVGLTPDGRARTLLMPTVGIVDPFLRQPVKAGERFWLFLYPGSIASLRHESSSAANASIHAREAALLSPSKAGCVQMRVLMNRRRAAQTWTPDDLDAIDVAYREVEDAQDAALAALYAEALPPERLERPEPDLDALARDYWGEDA